MTTKHIAEAVNRTERSVQGWAKRTGEKMASIGEKIASVQNKGKPADYNLDETVEIIATGLGRNAAELYRQNAERNTATVNSADIDYAFKLALVSLSRLTESHEARLNKIEDRIDKRESLLPAPKIDPRTQATKLVRELAHQRGISYREAWNLAYRDFGYRTKSNPKQVAKNREMTVIDYIDTEGQIETLVAVIADLIQEAA